MAYIYADRVQETTTTTGTGTITLAGASTQYQSFTTGVGDGNTCDYVILSGNGTDWETGKGTFTLSGTTLARTIIYASSNSNAAISLSGTSTVFLSVTAKHAPRGLYDLSARVPALSSFTSINISGTSSTVENSGIALSIIDTGKGTTSLAGLRIAVPSGAGIPPYRVAMLFLPTRRFASASPYQFGWSDGTKYETMSWGDNDGNSYYETWTNSTTRASATAVISIPSNSAAPFWIGLHNDSTHLVWEWSADGANWYTLKSETYAASFLGTGNAIDIFFGILPGAAESSILSCLCYDVGGLSRVVGV